ncbi:MAG: DUF3261 domain-containing protein [Burkholderiaceae bacterium]
MQRLIVAWSLAGAAVLAGCASAPIGSSAGTPADPRTAPQLRLAPALLGRAVNLQQHLTLQAQGHDQQLDVLLEADAHHVQMGVVAMGQVAARLDWDGVTLTENRATWWPPAVSGSRILSDLQLTLWPVTAIQSALPAGWRLVEDGNVRTLSQDGAAVTVITRLSPLVVELDQRREHFKLKIESRDLGNETQSQPPSLATP